MPRAWARPFHRADRRRNSKTMPTPRIVIRRYDLDGIFARLPPRGGPSTPEPTRARRGLGLDEGALVCSGERKASRDHHSQRVNVVPHRSAAPANRTVLVASPDSWRNNSSN
jgi:hypothetical protein